PKFASKSQMLWTSCLNPQYVPLARGLRTLKGTSSRASAYFSIRPTDFDVNCLPVPLQSDRTPESYSVFSVVAQESRYHTILRDYESNSARALIAETCSGAMPRTKALHRRFAEFRALLILSCLDVHAILWTIYMGSEPYDSKVREQHERTIHAARSARKL